MAGVVTSARIHHSPSSSDELPSEDSSEDSDSSSSAMESTVVALNNGAGPSVDI